MSSTASSAAAASSSSSSSHTGPRDAAAEDDEDEEDDKEYTQPPTNDDDDVEDVSVVVLLLLLLLLPPPLLLPLLLPLLSSLPLPLLPTLLLMGLSTAAFQEGWDSLTGPQQQQIIRASRSILANNEEEDDEDEEEFYDAQEYEQGDERIILMNDATAAADDDGGFDEERHTERCGTQIRRRVRCLKGVVVQRLRRLTGRPTALLQRAVQGRKQHHSNGSTSTKIRRSGAVCCGSFLHAIVQLPPKPFFTYTDKTARVVLTTVGAGFDPDNLNERANGGYTPLLWFIEQGNVTMVRYVIARGADCRQVDPDGCSPMLYAVIYGHLEIMKLLSRDGGAHEDIRRVNRSGASPLLAYSLLYLAFSNRHFHVVQWLILNEALSSPRDDAAGDGIDDALIWQELRQYSTCGKYSRIWDYDHRQTLLTWARDTVTTHDNVVKLPLAKLNGDVLKRIADYVVGTPQTGVRTLRQFVDRLTVFIADEPFIGKTVGEELINMRWRANPT